jgi:hypothetical protein
MCGTVAHGGRRSEDDTVRIVYHAVNSFMLRNVCVTKRAYFQCCCASMPCARAIERVVHGCGVPGVLF